MASRIQLFFKIGIIAILVSIFSLYGFYQAKDFLDGPKITINSPKNGSTSSKSYITIKGHVENISSIFLNGRQIFTDENGFFRENLLLALGYNIIEITVKDKFNREIKELRTIVVKP